MVSYLENNEGFLIAFVEWQIVDKNAQYKNDGEYCYVQELWIHKKFEGKRIINKLINLVNNHDFMKPVKWIYWLRGKYNYRLTKCLSRERLAKMGEYRGKI